MHSGETTPIPIRVYEFASTLCMLTCTSTTASSILSQRRVPMYCLLYWKMFCETEREIRNLSRIRMSASRALHEKLWALFVVSAAIPYDLHADFQALDKVRLGTAGASICTNQSSRTRMAHCDEGFPYWCTLHCLRSVHVLLLTP